MANDNPFAPPRATVRDVESGTQRYQTVSAFTWKGRIGRLRFIAYVVAAYLLMGVAIRVLGALSAMLHLPSWLSTAVVLIPYLVIVSMATIQRSHDMNWSGWMSLVLIASVVIPLVIVSRSMLELMSGNYSSSSMALAGLLPFIGLIWVFKGGTRGANRFGAPPPPNTTGVKLLAFLLPGIAIIGILAAIAIPAYADYTKRAKARQVQSTPAPATAPAPASP